MKRVFVLLYLLTVAGPLWAEEYNCINSIDKFDICAEAKRLQAEIAPSLPQMVEDSMMISSVSVFDNVLGLNITLLYEMEFLQDALQKADASMETLESNMVSQTQTSICSNPSTSAFVKLGGTIVYIYQLKDGEYLFQISVDEC